MTWYLPLEEKARMETEKHFAQWAQGPYEFLRQRTSNYYFRPQVASRRKRTEARTGLDMGILSDDLLLELYAHSLKRHKEHCLQVYENSGYQVTPSEAAFSIALETIMGTGKEFRHVEVYPSLNRSRDLPGKTKMLVGVHVPDFLVFGLKTVGFSSVAIEIDGDSHVEKHSKDFQRYRNLEECGVMAISIPNSKVRDLKYIEGCLRKMLRKRSGPLDKQIKVHKRKIWCKTVACQMTLKEIDSFAESRGIHLNLDREAECAAVDPCYPRAIRKELRACA